MERRTILAGFGTAAALGIASKLADAGTVSLKNVEESLTRLRQSLPTGFDPSYVEHVIVPFFLTSLYQGEILSLPMIDLKFSKENALPYDMWGLLYENWSPNPQEDGLTVFLQGLEKRGEDNQRKKIYFSALTPDLYRPMYRDKVMVFLNQLLDKNNAGKPLMRYYLDNYFDLYWDLHLGVKGNAIPTEVRQIGESFVTVLAYRDPRQQIVYDNYMKVRRLRKFLTEWIDERIADVVKGKVAAPEKTFVHYWIKNGGEGDNFRHKDVVFECFHNFVAFSQWGNTIYNIMSLLSKDTGNPVVQAWFQKTMKSDYNRAKNSAFTPLEQFVMELFRIISPNAGSISVVEEVRTPPYERYGYVISPHTETSLDPRHWKNPTQFDPKRYDSVPTSHQVDEAKSKQIGFAQCPFNQKAFEVKDGRKAELSNSAFGTVYGIVDGKALPVCDYAGFAPFGFGYRRCPGEQITIQVFEDFLKKVWKDKIVFEKLNLSNPQKLPIGPTTVIDDNFGFVKRSA